MIKIRLNNYQKAFNEYNIDRLSESLDNYIIREVRLVPLNNVGIIIEGKFNETEKRELIKKIHNYYKEKANYYDGIDKYDHVFRFILFLIGAILIILSYFFQNIISEVILIAGWVIIWEVIYDILFTNVKRKRKKYLYVKLSNCKITFEKENKNE
ncbi:MAG: hypothetical protein IJO33_03955 [Bacilli bacterium]|nr:hypothetical protein [Bacilli bacterium]